MIIIMTNYMEYDQQNILENKANITWSISI